MDFMSPSRALGSEKKVAKDEKMMTQLVKYSIFCQVNTGKLFSVLYTGRGGSMDLCIVFVRHCGEAMKECSLCWLYYLSIQKEHNPSILRVSDQILIGKGDK